MRVVILTCLALAGSFQAIHAQGKQLGVRGIDSVVVSVRVTDGVSEADTAALRTIAEIEFRRSNISVSPRGGIGPHSAIVNIVVGVTTPKERPNPTSFTAEVTVSRIVRIVGQTSEILGETWNGPGGFGWASTAPNAMRFVKDSVADQIRALVNDILASRGK